MDLAEGHTAAVHNLLAEKKGGIFKTYNLGTGSGVSVLQVISRIFLYKFSNRHSKFIRSQVISTFEKVNNIKIPYKIVPRRAGDVASSYCAVDLAKKELKWEAKFGIEDMCKCNFRSSFFHSHSLIPNNLQVKTRGIGSRKIPMVTEHNFNLLSIDRVGAMNYVNSAFIDILIQISFL